LMVTSLVTLGTEALILAAAAAAVRGWAGELVVGAEAVGAAMLGLAVAPPTEDEPEPQALSARAGTARTRIDRRRFSEAPVRSL
jgi:hypothetical protein